MARSASWEQKAICRGCLPPLRAQKPAASGVGGSVPRWRPVRDMPLPSDIRHIRRRSASCCDTPLVPEPGEHEISAMEMGGRPDNCCCARALVPVQMEPTDYVCRALGQRCGAPAGTTTVGPVAAGCLGHRPDGEPCLQRRETRRSHRRGHSAWPAGVGDGTREWPGRDGVRRRSARLGVGGLGTHGHGAAMGPFCVQPPGQYRSGNAARSPALKGRESIAGAT
jgi:hypothetical protein